MDSTKRHRNPLSTNSRSPTPCAPLVQMTAQTPVDFPQPPASLQLDGAPILLEVSLLINREKTCTTCCGEVNSSRNRTCLLDMLVLSIDSLCAVLLCPYLAERICSCLTSTFYRALWEPNIQSHLHTSAGDSPGSISRRGLTCLGASKKRLARCLP